MANDMRPIREVPLHWSITAIPPTKARERILCAASELFCHRGFSATGVDSVIAKALVAKATLYNHFSSKELLIASVLEAEGETWRAWFFGKLSLIEGSASDRVLAIFDILEDWFADPNFYGCPFINAVAEFEEGNQMIGKAAAQHMHFITSWIRANALEIGVPDPDEFTRMMVVQINGAIIAAQHTRDPAFARTAKDVARMVIRT